MPSPREPGGLRAAGTDTGALWSRLARIFRFAKPYRSRVALAVGVVLLGSGVSLVFPLGIRSLLDTAVQGGNSTLLHWLALGLFILFALRALLAFYGRYVTELVGEQMVIDLRVEIFGHMHSLDQMYLDEQRVGDLLSRLNSDASAIRNTVTETLIGLLLQSFQLIGSIAIMAWLNWRLTLIVLVVAPAASLLSRGFAPRLRGLARRVQEGTGRSLSVAQESLNAIRLVRSFARSGYEVERYHKSLRKLFAAVWKSARTNALFRALISFVTAIASIALFWYGGLEVISGRLSAGDLVAFLFYSQGIAQSVGQLASLYGELNLAAGASDRVFEVLDQKPNVVNAPDAFIPATVDGRLAFRDVHFGYQPGTPVLYGLDFEVAANETVAFVGVSGAGKTTLVHLLSRFFDPDEGAVELDGVDLRHLDLNWLRRQVALVSQDVFLFAESVRENIRYGRLDASDEEIEEAARLAEAHDFITAFPHGYDTVVGERGVKVSGGQRQRIALARAFLKDAKVLILDEATSAVDAASESRIRQACTRLGQDRTMLIVAHRFSSLVEADRILVMEQGKIVSEGSHEELSLRPGLYRELLENQRLESPRSDVRVAG